MDLVGFNLEDIAGKFETAALLTWSLIQILLDANLIAQHHKGKPSNKITGYKSHPGDSMLINTENDDGSGLDEEIVEAEDEESNTSLHIVSKQSRS